MKIKMPNPKHHGNEAASGSDAKAANANGYANLPSSADHNDSHA